MPIYPELEIQLIELRKLFNNRLKTTIYKVLQSLNAIEWIVNNEEDKHPVAAVDSSFLLIESRLNVLYVIQGIASLYTFDQDKIKNVKSRRYVNCGIINASPTNLKLLVKKSIYKKALTQYAYFLELKNLLEIASHDSIALIDGSLISFLMSRKFKEYQIIFIENEDEIDLDNIVEEKIKLISNLNTISTPVFIAKSSGANFLTNSNYSDMHLLELARIFSIEPYYRAGFTKPIVVDLEKLKIHIGSLHSDMVKLFTLSYMRFREGAPIFQVSMISKKDFDAVLSIYRCIRGWSPAGYPIPLEYVHRLSKLSRREIHRLLIRLGIPIMSGREIIEI
ncbi:NurA domain [Ignisphaera aggregans DSM 17230]|uniref:NurA domain n=1 Tax=Ignisphaera aggregans (strain DSM 17230 / JCM 13409 / AQ1.S1) TaxID=583356 RepID=E0SQJ8_IGNAA|nr:NurA domain [Ignisphaera aggregans DSM 17230]